MVRNEFLSEYGDDIPADVEVAAAEVDEKLKLVAGTQSTRDQ